MWIWRQVGPRLRTIMIIAGLTPLLLTFLGDDAYRWYVISVIGLLGMTLIIQGLPDRLPALPEPESEGTGSVPATVISQGLILVGLTAIVIAMFFPYPYFLNNDGYPLGQTVAHYLSAMKHLVT